MANISIYTTLLSSQLYCQCLTGSNRKKIARPKAIHMLASVWMSVNEVQQLPNRNRVENILYHARCAGFELLSNVFLTQLKSIYNRH